MDRIYKIFPSPGELVEAFARKLVVLVSNSFNEKHPFSIALSGGTTPKLLFKLLAEKYSESVDWRNVHFFWGDERCVPPDNPESNYGSASRIFLSKINIPEKNIHRIKGEDDPLGEAVRYGAEIMDYTDRQGNFPEFNIIILGVGNDGHTASIFPGNSNLLNSEVICEVSRHPVSGQKRITLTGKVINNADSIFFLVSGSGKARIINRIFRKEAGSPDFPAGKIIPVHGTAEWWLDKNAGALIR